jgi:hypothetical protein
MSSLDFEMFEVLEGLKKAFEEKNKGPQGIILIDFPEHADYVKKLITRHISPDLDFVVVSAAIEPMPLTLNFNKTHALMSLLADQIEESDNGKMLIEAPSFQSYLEPAPEEKRKDRPHFRDIEYKGKYPSLKR